MSFLTHISKDIEWRMSELASLKTIPIRYKMMNHHKSVLIKYNIPAIYALWEGYVKNSFTVYAQELNKLDLAIHKVHLNLLVHSFTIDDKLNLENLKRNFTKRKEFFKYFQTKALKPLQIGDKLPLRSNVDFNVINDILHRFNLEQLPQPYKKRLAKLLKFRNSIVHGENSLPTKIDDISVFSMLVNELMVEIYERIEQGYLTESFLDKDS